MIHNEIFELTVPAVQIGSSETDGFSVPVLSAAETALRHVRERNGAVVRELAFINRTRFVSHAFDTESDGFGGLIAYRQAHERGVHGIVGAARSAVSEPVAQTAAVDRTVQLSYWSSSPDLADKSVYPFFGRTYPSDALGGRFMVQLVQSFGWRNFATINVVDAYASAYISVMLAAISELPTATLTVTVKAVFHADDADGARHSVQRVQSSGVNVVVAAVFDSVNGTVLLNLRPASRANLKSPRACADA